MGGDAGIVALGIPYARIFLMFTPFFMCNYIVSAFVRNDGDPSLAMVATLSSSLFNVVFDYIFMFPMGLGLAGAALATAVSPIISISICSRHFFKKENSVQFVRQRPSARLLGQSCQLGISGFVGEMSSGVTTTVFNLLLLGLAGNVAVAAYGVVANFALVATAIFNGVAQGAQPLVSECYGKATRPVPESCLSWAAALHWCWQRCCTASSLVLPMHWWACSTAKAPPGWPSLPTWA